MRLVPYLIVACLIGGASAVFAAPARRPAARPAPKRPAPPPAGPALRSIEVVPAEVRLVGPRSEQGLIVTGRYADGSTRDLTRSVRYAVANPAVATVVVQQGRRALKPRGNGTTQVTVTAAGVPARQVTVTAVGVGELAPVSFRDEVVPALTKAGCNQGICHGTPTGKGGFRLSLQGYAPELDYASLVGEGGARRVNKADPGRSILLLKPLAEMAHGGGKRLAPGQPEYDVLVRWIAEGLRDDPPDQPAMTSLEILPGKRQLMLPAAAEQQIAVMARFADGSVRDVTNLAKLETSNPDQAEVSREGLVRGAGFGEVAVLARYQHLLVSERLTYLRRVPGFRWAAPPENNFVDRHVFAKLKLYQIQPSDLSTDREFLRRAYLDTVGVLPTPDEVRAFEADPAPDKRSRLIDRLTERPEFADQWALRWADVLRVQDETMKESGARAFHRWIRDSFAANKSMDQFVREIITASGPATANPPANFYRAYREPDDYSQAAAQLFIGVRMTCAKCHNHPFERWTQDEYYQFAAFFSQVRVREGPGREEETVRLEPNGQVRHLRTGAVMRPKLLGGPFPEIARGQDRRESLAAWMTAKDNPFFARATVNRVWANVVGRGIVEPIDDFRDSNPGVNEELLDALAEDFTRSGFDLRHLVRTIMKSRTYQLSARPNASNKDDGLYYSKAFTRLMTAEQLADSLSQVLGVPDQYPGYPAGTRAMQLSGTKARTPFLKTFGRPDRNLNCECEREKDPNLFQALSMITGRNVDAKLRSDEGRVARLAASQKPDDEVLDELYLAALTRHPTPDEKREMLAFLKRAESRRQALEDVAWALVNSKEFLFRY